MRKQAPVWSLRLTRRVAARSPCDSSGGAGDTALCGGSLAPGYSELDRSPPAYSAAA